MKKDFFRKLLPDPFEALFILGSAAIVIGAYKIYHPLAWIVGGAIAVRASWLAASSRREHPDK